MKKYIFLFSSFLFFLSCKNEVKEPSHFSAIIDISDPLVQQNLTNEFGVYTGMFTHSHHKLKVHSTANHSFHREDVSVSGGILAFNRDLDNDLFNVEGGDYYVNDLKYSFDDDRYKLQDFSGDLGEYIADEIMGKTVVLKYESDTENIRKEFNVSSPLIIEGINETKIPNTNLTEISRNDLSFPYNKDLRNGNGIFVTFTYRGMSINTTLGDLENVGGNTEIRRAIHVRSESADGILHLPSSFFDGIPVGAIVTMHFYRDNGEMFISDSGEKIKFLVKSEHQFEAVVL